MPASSPALLVYARGEPGPIGVQKSNLDTAIQRLTLDIPDYLAAAEITGMYHNLLQH